MNESWRRKMKKFNKILTALSLGLIGAGLYTPTVDALTSNATVDFTNPTQAPAIVNPDNPGGEPLENPETDGEVSGEFGSLTLDYVSNFDFGSHELNRNEQNYFAENQRTPFAQVTDVRGTGAGWRLVAQFNGFTQDGNASLQGAEINLTNSELVTTQDNMNTAPTTSSAGIVLNQNAADITIAEEGQGKGTWLTKWADDDNAAAFNQSVVLSVPAAVATAGEHTGTITWTLYNTPTGTDSEPVNQTTQP